MPMTTQPYQATEERKHLTTGGPGKEQGTNKLPATRILQRSTRGQQEMGDCSPEVLATSSEQQRPRILLKYTLNIDEENKVGGKLTVWFRSLRSLLGEPT